MAGDLALGSTMKGGSGPMWLLPEQGRAAPVAAGALAATAAVGLERAAASRVRVVSVATGASTKLAVGLERGGREQG